jgi:hypothetical protein
MKKYVDPMKENRDCQIIFFTFYKFYEKISIPQHVVETHFSKMSCNRYTLMTNYILKKNRKNPVK